MYFKAVKKQAFIAVSVMLVLPKPISSKSAEMVGDYELGGIPLIIDCISSKYRSYLLYAFVNDIHMKAEFHQCFCALLTAGTWLLLSAFSSAKGDFAAREVSICPAFHQIW